MDIDYNDLFGIEAKTPEVAEPEAEQEVPEGEKESPAEDAGQEAGEKPEQSREERAANAARRRESEKQAEYQRGREEARKELSAMLEGIGIDDPNGEGKIDTVEKMESYAKSLKDKRLAGRIAAGDSDAIDEAIDRRLQARKEHPNQQSDVDTQRQIDDQLAEIRKYDPNITSLSELAHREGDEFSNYLKRGFNLSEAYKMVHYNDIMANTAAAAGRRDAEAAKSSGKSHLSPASNRGSGAVSVPSDVMSLYRALMPDATEAEITRHYNKNHK